MSSSTGRLSLERKKGPIDESTPETEYEKELKAKLKNKDEKLYKDGGLRVDNLHLISDLTILRFIRGYNQPDKKEDHERKVSEMLTKFMEWRIESKVEDIARTKIDYIERVWASWPSGCHGIGKSNHPIYVERVGMIDPPALLKQGLDMTKIMPVHIQVMESLCNLKERLSKAHNKNIYKHIVILDLDGIGAKHLTKAFYGPLKTFIDIDQFFYPETLHRMFIVNAPFMIKALWAIVSPWVDPLTKAKFIWGTDKLHEYIDKDQLPAFLGGTCKCRDKNCLKVPFVSGKENSSEELGLLIPLPPLESVDTKTTTTDEKSKDDKKDTSSSSSSSSSSSQSSSTSSSSSAEKKDEKKTNRSSS